MQLEWSKRSAFLHEWYTTVGNRTYCIVRATTGTRRRYSYWLSYWNGVFHQPPYGNANANCGFSKLMLRQGFSSLRAAMAFVEAINSY